MKIRGWVYVVVNRAMPALVKIGYSTKDPVIRARELANTGSPHPYQVIYDALVDNPRLVESQVHEHLSKLREGREWFRCSASAARLAIRACAPSLYAERDSLNTEPSLKLVGEKCCYSPDCKTPPTRLYHNAPYCEAHHETYMKGRKAFRQMVGRRSPNP